MAKKVEFKIGDNDVPVKYDGQNLFIYGEKENFDNNGKTKSFYVEGSFRGQEGLERRIVPYKAELTKEGISLSPSLTEMPVRDKIAIEENRSAFPNYKIFTNSDVKEFQVGDRTLSYNPHDKENKIYCDNKELDFSRDNRGAFMVIDGRGYFAKTENNEIKFNYIPLSWDVARDKTFTPPEYNSVKLNFDTPLDTDKNIEISQKDNFER